MQDFNSKINRRDFLKVTTLGALALSVSPLLSARKSSVNKKNILFIAVDDLKPILGCYENEQVISPNFDAIASAGTTFLNNHCQQSVCAPSRASLLTGMRPDYTRVWDLKTLIRDQNPGITTIPQYFRDNDYQTAATGKIFDPRSVDNSHDSVSWTIPYDSPTGDRWMISTEPISTESADVPDDEFMDGKIADRGIELMKQMAGEEKPFFLAIGFKKPHLPFVAPKKYWDLYQRDDFSIHSYQEQVENSPDFAYHNSGELRNNYVDISSNGLIPQDKQKELIHGYHACVSFIDAQIGRIVEKLDSLGLKEDTVIIIWGDHGWHLGDHALWCKHSNFEQATRSPLIIASSELSGNKKTASPTEFIDIFPTLCQLSGNDIPVGLDGTSLVPIMENPETSVKDFAISQYHRTVSGAPTEGYSLRTKRYRYIEWLKNFKSTEAYAASKIVGQELYDYEVDPLETKSLIDDPSYSTVVSELQTSLVEFLASQEIIIEESDNLLKNSDFEFGISYWNAKQCSIKIVQDPVYSGSNALLISDRTKNYSYAEQDISDALIKHGPGKYHISAFMRSVSDNTLAVKLRIKININGETKYFLADEKALSSDHWTELKGTVDLNWDTANFENAFIHFPTSNNNNNYYLDKCSLLTDSATAIEDDSSEVLPEKLSIDNYPNPFNPSTNIIINIPKSSNVKLSIYDLKGRQIKQLFHQSMNPGRKRFTWDSKDENNNPVAGGVYIAKLQVGHTIINKKITLIK